MKSLMTALMLVAATALSAQLEPGNIIGGVGYELGFGYSQSASIDGEDAPDSAFEGSDVSNIIAMDTFEEQHKAWGKKPAVVLYNNDKEEKVDCASASSVDDDDEEEEEEDQHIKDVFCVC